MSLLGAAMLLAVSLASPATAGTADLAPVVREHTEAGTPAPEPLEQVGWSRLVRTSAGLDAKVHVAGLQPGGVYTFWWVVVQDDGTFPDDIFVASGAGTIVGRNGKATVRMHADRGDAAIEGFEPAPGVVLEFDELHDPLGALVRVEIAYHGQAVEAGDELDAWLTDFWTGTACPPETPNPNPAQPHCPVWFAATHG